MNTSKQNIQTRQQSNQTRLEKTRDKAAKILKQVESKREEFETLISKYENFNAEILDNKSSVVAAYNKEWQEKEKDWYKNWDPNTLAGWFEYVLRSYQNNDSNEKEFNADSNSNDTSLENSFKINFHAIGEAMQHFRLKHLLTLDKEELEEYGIVDNKCCNILLNAVKRMVTKYKYPKALNNEIDNQQIAHEEGNYNSHNDVQPHVVSLQESVKTSTIVADNSEYDSKHDDEPPKKRQRTQ